MLGRLTQAGGQFSKEGDGPVAACNVPTFPSFVLAGAEVSQWIESGRLFVVLLSEPNLVPAEQGVIQQRGVVSAEHELCPAPA